MTQTKIIGSLNGAPEKLDPAAIVDSAQWHALINLGVNLITHDHQGRLLGEAAKSWTVSDDFQTFSFDLVEGLRDSDGNPLDSSDWKATFLHLLRSGGSTHSFISEFLAIDGIVTPSPTRLILHLKQPYKTLIQRLTTPEFILLPKRAIMTSGEVDLKISSGPYRVKEFDRADQSCTLEVNRYWSHYSLEQFQEVVLKQRPNRTGDLIQNLASGAWGFSIFMPIPTDPEITKLENFVQQGKIISRPTELSSVGFVLFFDTKRLNTRAQRLALAAAIGDRADLDLNRLSAKAARQIYPPGFSGALAPEDEVALKKSIKASSNLNELPEKLVGYGSVGGFLSGAPQWVEKALKDAGIDVSIKEMPYTDYQEKHKSWDHDFVVVMTGMNAKDPAGSLLTLLSPKSGIIPDPDGALNALLQQAVQADTNRRAQFLHDVSSRLISEGRIVPFVHYGNTVLSSASIDAFPPTRYDDELRLSEIRWKK
ncbi:MAG: ABC transporter substrate-binding protein [Oligoflexia bacterium]|nr:ABC transporter substrate-binding protein [Oligoflexia bacterium]